MISSNNPVTIPAGSDAAAVSLVINPIFKTTGVTASAQLIVQHFRAASDGTGPVKVGDRTVVNVPDIFAAAATDPALAAAVTAIEAAIQAYVTAKNL